MKRNFAITADAKNGKAVIEIRGFIHEWSKNNSYDFSARIDQLIAQGITDAEVYINSGGGDVFEANEIANIIGRFPGTINGCIGAVCASAATIIAIKCKSVTIAPNGFFMVHKPKGDLYGTAEQIQNNLKLLMKIEQVYLQTYAKRTGMTEQEITKKWNTDWWMTAQESVDMGFVDAISDAESDLLPEEAEELDGFYAKAPMKFAAQFIPTSQSQNMSKILMLAPSLGLTASAKEEEVIVAIQAVVTERDTLKTEKQTLSARITELENEKKTADDQKAVALIEAAVTEGKVPADKKDEFIANAKKDYPLVQSMLSVMKPHTTITGKLNADDNDPVAKERAAWKWDEWHKKDPKALEAMKSNDFARFNALYKGKYGKDYK